MKPKREHYLNIIKCKGDCLENVLCDECGLILENCGISDETFGRTAQKRVDMAIELYIKEFGEESLVEELL